MVRQQNRTDKRWYQWQRRPSHPAPDTAVAVVADTDGISKANGSQKLISERDFCSVWAIGGATPIIIVIVSRSCCFRRRLPENRKGTFALHSIPISIRRAIRPNVWRPPWLNSKRWWRCPKPVSLSAGHISEARSDRGGGKKKKKNLTLSRFFGGRFAAWFLALAKPHAPCVFGQYKFACGISSSRR